MSYLGFIHYPGAEPPEPPIIEPPIINKYYLTGGIDVDIEFDEQDANITSDVTEVAVEAVSQNVDVETSQRLVRVTQETRDVSVRLGQRDVDVNVTTEKVDVKNEC